MPPSADLAAQPLCRLGHRGWSPSPSRHAQVRALDCQDLPCPGDASGRAARKPAGLCSAAVRPARSATLPRASPHSATSRGPRRPTTLVGIQSIIPNVRVFHSSGILDCRMRAGTHDGAHAHRLSCVSAGGQSAAQAAEPPLDGRIGVEAPFCGQGHPGVRPSGGKSPGRLHGCGLLCSWPRSPGPTSSGHATSLWTRHCQEPVHS